MQKTKAELKFEYTNWKGEKRIRKVQPIEIWYGKTQYHPKEGWFLRAIDLEKGEERNFCLKDIIKFF